MHRSDFWAEVFTWQGSVTPYVILRVLFFGAFATVVYMGSERLAVDTGLGVAPYEIVGAVLALLLVLRTNAGYDRWYEARKLWGGIVNQSRNLAIAGLSYESGDLAWRERFVRWTAAFGTRVTPCFSRTSRRALTNWFGKSASSRLANVARRRSVPVV